MQFYIFDSSLSAKKGRVCTREIFEQVSRSKEVYDQLNEIARCQNPAEIGELKKKLPAITWQASYANGHRKNCEAVPSGLFILDIDKLASYEEASRTAQKVMGQRAELNIVYIGITPSRRGVRVVAECPACCSTIEEAQAWLAGQLGVSYDVACKDWARCSYVVHEEYFRFIDYSLFDREPKVVYENLEVSSTKSLTCGSEVKTNESCTGGDDSREERKEPSAQDDGYENEDHNELSKIVENSQKLSNQSEYKGLKLEQIAKEWLLQNGGEPEEGERNNKLFKLALRMRYITDFNEQVLLKNLPAYGLSESEMKTLIHSACSHPRQQDAPQDLLSVIDSLEQQRELLQNSGISPIDERKFLQANDTRKVPKLPPIFKQWYNAAPDDFKVPAVICQLPVLGALGSRLRAKYFDGVIHSPSFQVSLEAPQASGKSFVKRIVMSELKAMIDHDQSEREKERAYNEVIKEQKALGIKVSAKDKEKTFGSKPQVLIRYVSPKMSITQMLIRMNAAKELHLFGFAEEIDTVSNAFKSGFSSYSDALRCAFDNSLYGQDYASENSFSGLVPMYYNTLFTGTPNAMSRFYKDTEDGLISRVTFVKLPDQFGKPNPIWKPFTKSQKATIDLALERLNAISIQGDEVQPEHVMNLDWLAEAMNEWCLEQQQYAVITDDRNRDLFCRRSAVVGFRAGMLAWFLWEEVASPAIRNQVIKFSRWIANVMINQQLNRFSEMETSSAVVIPHQQLFNLLDISFTRDDIASLCKQLNISTPVHSILYKWRKADLLQPFGRKTQIIMKNEIV